ncbi:uncharacterized protein F5Z01DRAFT_632845 [Emericellopsis atlantica]|uniref:Extracellular matrix protein n=1 Tax=Emericellopsis atlantica TaxID=2614577 RepID=A0A9P7ZU58_9HYPO|nr:uncharacterized protein F5Z01DRAFT_632845 [Emericellopsis atlantica]KAG9257822.1 hypothetical protein F5Z01DRAFT_632845 [Emericellopsis atlantica]
MKYSAAVLSLAAVVAAQPAFTNLSFDVKEGEPFTLEFTGCDEGCTINLKDGPSGDLKTVEQLTDSATGGSFTFTPENLPTGTYAFEIVDAQGEDNYSEQFDYEGVAAAPTSTVVTKTTEVVKTLTTSTMTSTTEEETTTSTSAAVTTVTTPVTTVTQTSTTSDMTTPTEEATQSETSAGASPTEIPDGGSAAAGLAAPGTLLFAAIAGLLMFN